MGLASQCCILHWARTLNGVPSSPFVSMAKLLVCTEISEVSWRHSHPASTAKVPAEIQGLRQAVKPLADAEHMQQDAEMLKVEA